MSKKKTIIKMDFLELGEIDMSRVVATIESNKR